MAWTKFQWFIVVLMVVTGTINSLAAKWADELKAAGRDGKKRKFTHPFMQGCCMFLGEMMCFFAYKIIYYALKRKQEGLEDTNNLTKGNRNFNPLIFFIPAMCDMAGTCLMYFGLHMTYVSSFQMIRGAIIIFVALLSMIFFRRFLKALQWVGISSIIVGLCLVGVADFITQKTDQPGSTGTIIIGDVMIFGAQFISAIQMVVQEVFVNGKDIPPLQAVGWEGMIGFTVLGLLQIPFYFIPAEPPFSNNSRNVLEDVLEGFVQCYNNWLLIIALTGLVISIAFFNFAGLSITKELSATTRVVLDTLRTLFVWCFSLAVFGQTFHFLQLLGFLSLICGMGLYNNLISKECCIKMKEYMHKKKPEEEGNAGEGAAEPKK